MIECKAVIFDLDGTLVDSSECIEKIWRKWCVEYNINFNNLIAVSHGRPTLETMKEFLPSADTKMADWFLEQEMNETEDLKQIEGAAEFIEKLPKNLWGIATSGVINLASARIEGAGLSIPNVLITADKIEKGKPDPESFIKAAAQLGVKPEECIIFEDSKPGIKAGIASGATVIGIKMHLQEEEMTDAVFTINNFSELVLNVVSTQNGKILKINKK
jgi:mannitol-1-/sugar-/sorbitol-6-phosphatase